MHHESGYSNIFFSPEFLREGHALYDNLNPSRIVIGLLKGDSEALKHAEDFASLLKENAIKKDIPTLFVGTQEAESIKLFANTYLAMRVSFFNDLDTYAEEKQLSSKEIIEGICLDPRIGAIYNNPSFGYGGYCLPKDTKQLLSNYADIPEAMISATVRANDVRKHHVVRKILEKANHKLKNGKRPVIGVYRLVMKSGSDNFRQSAVQNVIELLHEAGAKIVIYEPTLLSPNFGGYEVIQQLELFKTVTDVVIANRLDDELCDITPKVYSRDLYSRD